MGLFAREFGRCEVGSLASESFVFQSMVKFDMRAPILQVNTAIGSAPRHSLGGGAYMVAGHVGSNKGLSLLHDTYAS